MSDTEKGQICLIVDINAIINQQRINEGNTNCPFRFNLEMKSSKGAFMHLCIYLLV